MKKMVLLAMLSAAVSFSAKVQASSLSFSFGENFLNLSSPASLQPQVQGTAAELDWTADDFSFGLQAESDVLELSDHTAQNFTFFSQLPPHAALNIFEVRADKWFSDFVSIGAGV